MNKFFKIECITNLHMGSGDVNYNIVDKEVEKDPVTGFPMMHASGVKGAIRDHYLANLEANEKNEAIHIFGTQGDDDKGIVGKGAYKFLDAKLLARPMRVDSDTLASVLVFSEAMINDFIKLCSSFSHNINSGNTVSGFNFGENKFLVSNSDIRTVEGEPTAMLSEEEMKKLAFLEDIIGKNFAITKNINEYDLPVLARNCLQEGKENLWFEEIVPCGSIFYFGIFTPDKEFSLNFDKVVQFGAHASIGRGFCKITEI